ncbi:MmcQ/YjbR family DNA-binding protein [Maribrevibacterium harenarium]|uniref:MmcQ/YjbR family DNA-binding protein n=1 Tax=Maribrevibacterium harenarium TaxID=2589817 RepID=A0A501WZ27_9GAMM|nr:MmcQ/YjbR family DNA-binding protein [Maribrevibacterium harenarium]TPE54122.1 MmcQ/YjbR family DNA-binding protein [Maribrevibacterium harenarium]
MQALIDYLRNKPEAEETYPFGPEPRVYKVQNKMFALLTRHDGKDLLNLKCPPDHAIELRDIFPAVIPAWHMNKKHWNSVILDGSLPAGEIERLIDLSYAIVVQGMTQKVRAGLEARHGSTVIYQGLLPN